ncbi:hypothetical protein [Sphingomonas glacialis]|uniref:hypothetical protein n=1 Tax=Sphingomonas glacialis TaxID=658225 RepID=UPI001E5C94A3|nr:hypothetical protein [Sphingomonas glacialis]
MLRFSPIVGLLGLLLAAPAVEAASSSFDLVGPRLDVSVVRDGVTLPLERVPNLAEGDHISVKLAPLAGHDEHYRLIAVFLRGAVDRPGKDWFREAESWREKNASLSLVVPKDAQQMALFIVPERGGGANAVISAVRKQPGAFVRAAQELNQASLDRARLDTFLLEMQRAERKNPESLAAVSPVLTRSLAVKLKAECLAQPTEVQSACLTGDRETLLLADTHSSALADTLAGAPTDLAFQLSATPQAGYGSYSSYIGVVRDLFRMFGAFQSTQLQFIPALAQQRNATVTVLLNTPVSFAKPTSVMVVALPAIEAPKPPPLRQPLPATMLCAAPGVILPVEGAPLVYATGYAHDMVLRLKRLDGTQAEMPVRADPSLGGFVATGEIPFGPFGPVISAQLHGAWGFSSFDGPSYVLTKPGDGTWKATDRTALVVGRSNELQLTGGSAGCVTKIGLRRGDGAVEPLSWKQSATHGIVATVPLEQSEPGTVSIVIEEKGVATPTELPLRALQQAGSVDELSFHAGDDQATLTGTRLDQVIGVTLGTLAFQPGALTRVGKQDRVALQAANPASAMALAAGTTLPADISYVGGRHKSLSVTIAPHRVSATLLRVTARAPVRDGALPITLPGTAVFAQDARLTFAFHLNDAPPLSGRESIEIGTVDGRTSTMVAAGKGYDLQDAKTGIVSINPAEALGPTAYGALRFRIASDGAGSSWTPLATVVRLPEIHSISCAARKACKLTGNRFFLIEAVGTNAEMQPSQAIPDGFVATEITTRASADGRIYLRLRDAPEAIATVAAP